MYGACWEKYLLIKIILIMIYFIEKYQLICSNLLQNIKLSLIFPHSIPVNISPSYLPLGSNIFLQR